jgi:hypothetical protein
MPVVGMADGHVTPVVKAQESTGMWGWVTSNAAALNKTRADKWANLVDPDQKITLLHATVAARDTEIARLTTELSVQEIRLQVTRSNLSILRRAISDLHLLFVTGGMKHLIEVVPDVPAMVTPDQ